MTTVHFENYGRFHCTIYVYDEVFGEARINYGELGGLGLKTCADFIENSMREHPGAYAADIYDAETGEVVATFDSEPEEVESDWEDGDWDKEMGFDPYEGCYTWDC